MPSLCNHCTRPVCAEVCDCGANYERPEDGIVLVDETRCQLAGLSSIENWQHGVEP